jgi:hypothetical protein
MNHRTSLQAGHSNGDVSHDEHIWWSWRHPLTPHEQLHHLAYCVHSSPCDKQTMLLYVLSLMSHCVKISMIAVRLPFGFSNKNWAIICPTMFSKFPVSVYVCASLILCTICQKLPIHSFLLINVNVTYKEGRLVTIFL